MARDRAHPHTSLSVAIEAVVDRIIGRHGRSALSAAAPSDRALLERQKVAFARTAGILKDAENLDWETPEKTSAWVRASRAADSRATDEKLSSRPTP